MPLQQILPTWLALNAANNPSPTGMADIRTGDPIPGGGLNLGDYFDLTEKEANRHSYTTNGLLHSGRYRWVKLDAGANPAMIAIGKLGFMPTLLSPEVNIVTSLDHGVNPIPSDGTVRVCVFLNVITPGNYGFVQEKGVATVSVVGAAPVGDPMYVGANGDVVPAAGTHIGGAAIATMLVALAASGLGLVLLDLKVIQG